jgi:hypothetical protein
MNNIDEPYDGALRRETKARIAAEDSQLPEPEELDPDAPAPRLQALVNQYGSGPCARALQAWQARMMGESIIEVARQVGLPIESAKELLREVHTAVAEDLKENLDQNRSLDLARIDTIISAHLPKAQQGKVKSAQLVLRCLERRAKLVGHEALPAPTHSSSTSVLVWLQGQMPNINSLVDSLPTELPPPAPGG